jgi:beta-mannosidase
VPGHVHLDLMRAGVIGDPFYRMHERGCRWVDETDWTYRTTFSVSSERLESRGASGRHFLHFHGLDTLARVFLNGTQIGEAENFFVPHRFDVTDALREGDNELRVEFDSALRVGRERADAYLGDGTSERGASSYFNFGPRAFVRKPQYMFGWDWGPELVSCGLWQKVVLETIPVARLVDWRHTVRFRPADPKAGEPERAIVNVEAFVERMPGARDAPLTLRGAIEGIEVEYEAAFEDDELPQFDVAPVPIGDQRVSGASVCFSIRNPRRWWPNGANPDDPHSHPPLYRLRLTLSDQTGPADELTAHIGLRTIELVREPDPDGNGEGFQFRVNGRPIFIKGANWIPDDSFPARLENRPGRYDFPADQRVRERIFQACDAGFNMLRVWGGGLYESDHFYELCDAHGILVWQDFPFACSMYPDDLPEFVQQVQNEATLAVRRLRNHASLALWCGGNENVQLAHDRWAGKTQATRFFGDTLIHDTLPDVVAREDPRTPTGPTRPTAAAATATAKTGATRTTGACGTARAAARRLDPLHGKRLPLLVRVRLRRARRPRRLEPGHGREDKTVHSPVSRWHDKTRKGYETYLGYIARHFPAPQTWDDLIYYGQANQALALQCGIEHWRRRKGRCWGTLFWQLNDCWPTHSWAVIDSAGMPKWAYYACQARLRFPAPVAQAHRRRNRRGSAPGQ